MIEGYYGEQLFPLIDETVEFLSQGSNDILHLSTNSILTVENTASITVSSGTQSIFSSDTSIYLNQQSGSTNLYVSDFKNLSAEIIINQGNFSIFLENHTDLVDNIEIKNNMLLVGDEQTNISLKSETNMPAEVVVYSLNNAGLTAFEFALSNSEDLDKRTAPLPLGSENKDISEFNNEPQIQVNKEETPPIIFEQEDVVIEVPENDNYVLDSNDEFAAELKNIFIAEKDELSDFLEKVQDQLELSSRPDSARKLVFNENKTTEDIINLESYDDLIFDDAIDLIE